MESEIKKFEDDNTSLLTAIRILVLLDSVMRKRTELKDEPACRAGADHQERQLFAEAVELLQVSEAARPV